MSQPFIHLHLHTQFSLLDGACRIKDIFQKARELGMPAVAMTDHGNLFGVIDFYDEAVSAGIKPIIGMGMMGHTSLMYYGSALVIINAYMRKANSGRYRVSF